MMPLDSAETDELLARLNSGDSTALERLLELHRAYLHKLIDLRMDDELRSRIDSSDVIQETQLAVSRNIQAFLKDRSVAFRIWLRSKALERMIDLRRRHLAEKRSVRRELRLSDESSMLLARHLLEGRPSQILQRKELADQVRAVIMELNETDREILLLRHLEQLSNAEAAEVLAIQPAAARKRLGRAMMRLSQSLLDQGLQLDN